MQNLNCKINKKESLNLRNKSLKNDTNLIHDFPKLLYKTINPKVNSTIYPKIIITTRTAYKDSLNAQIVKQNNFSLLLILVAISIATQ